MVSAGKLRERIKIQRAAETRDANGGVTQTWGTEKSTWASINPATGREIFQAAQVDARVTHKIKMRFDPKLKLTAKDRILFTCDNRIFNIRVVMDSGERSREYAILAEEDV